ncbi:hypothetical protein PKCBPO_03573 [Methylorubrum thiocyanatum]
MRPPAYCQPQGVCITGAGIWAIEARHDAFMTTPPALPAICARRRFRRLPDPLASLPQGPAMTMAGVMMARPGNGADGSPSVTTGEAAVLENRLGA